MAWRVVRCAAYAAAFETRFPVTIFGFKDERYFANAWENRIIYREIYF